MPIEQTFSEGVCSFDKCSVKSADFQCINCGIYYCGVSCQMSHWPTHKEACIPRLVLASKGPTVRAKLVNMVPSVNVEPSPDLTPKIVPREEHVWKSNLQTRIENLRKETTKIVTKCEKAMKSSLHETNYSPNIEKTMLTTTINQLLKANQDPKAADNEKSAIKSIPREDARSLQHGPFPDPGRVVKICYVDNDKLYIYDAAKGPNNEPNNFQSLVVRSLQCAQTVKDHLSKQPEAGNIVFAPFEDEFYRGVVKSVQNGMAEIFFPDFGNSLKTEWNNLKNIPDPKIKYAKIVAHPVWIDNVKKFTPRMREFLEALVDTCEFVLTTVIDMPRTHTRVVEMRNKREKYNLSEKLLALQDPAASLGIKKMNVHFINIKEENIRKMLASQFSHSKLVPTNPGTYTPVYIANLVELNIEACKESEFVITCARYAFTKHKISVIFKSNASMYEHMLHQIQEYGQIDPNPYSPREHEIVLLKFEGVWYRAMAMAMADGKGKHFYLLDLPAIVGVENTTPEIRRYPPGVTRNLYVTECILKNPRFLLKNTGGDESKMELLVGVAITADVYQTIDDEMGETPHLTILCME